MTIAELRGKLEPFERREDLLTSDVFGTFKYLEPKYGLRQLLSLARNIENKYLDMEEEFNVAKFKFWPKMLDGTEPDLMIELRNRRNKTKLVMIEAKFRIPGTNRSERDIVNQLSSEYENLEYCRFKPGMVDSDPSAKYLLYVTSDHSMPVSVLRSTLIELRKKGIDAQDGLFWVSWREVPKLIDGNRKNWRNIRCQSYGLLKDLRDLLVKKSLVKFDGFSDMPGHEFSILGRYVYYADLGFRDFEKLSRWKTSYIGACIFYNRRLDFGDKKGKEHIEDSRGLQIHA